MKAKVFFLTAVAAVMLLSCGPTESDNAAALVAQIEQLYADGKYDMLHGQDETILYHLAAPALSQGG